MNSSYVPFPDLFINRLRRTKPFAMPVLHYHDGYEIFYVKEGGRDFFINDSEYHINAGAVLLIRPFEMHFSFSAENPIHERYVINFKQEHLDDFLTDSEFQRIDSLFDKRVLRLDANKQKYLNNLFEIMTNINKNIDDSKIAQKVAPAELLHLCYILQSAKSDNNESLKLSPIFSALKYINENFEQDLSLAYISNFTHLSQEYFCRLFKKTTGTTFVQYLNNIRVNNAHRLLTTTDKSLSKIAEECGFSSVAHMTRIFNANYGIPPSKFNRKTN